MRREAIELDVDLSGFGAAEIIDHQVMTHADLKPSTRPKIPQCRPQEGYGRRVDRRQAQRVAAGLFLPDDPPEALTSGGLSERACAEEERRRDGTISKSGM